MKKRPGRKIGKQPAPDFFVFRPFVREKQNFSQIRANPYLFGRGSSLGLRSVMRLP